MTIKYFYKPTVSQKDEIRIKKLSLLPHLLNIGVSTNLARGTDLFSFFSLRELLSNDVKIR